MKLYYIWLVLFWAVVVRAKHEEYTGWKSYYVLPSTRDQLKVLGALTNKLNLDFLSHAAVDREALVLVEPEHQVNFIEMIEEEGIAYWTHSDDVKAQLDIDDQVIKARSFSQDKMPYDDYQSLDVIYNYIDSLVKEYSDLVTLVTPAKSFEGRPIKYLKISSSNFKNASKSVVFIEATIHPREWIAPPVATYTLHKLVENLTDPGLLQNFDWIILPVANPDGYVYTFEYSRFWRKTMSTDQSDNSQRCPGVDANRNFDFYWNTVGVSKNPCDDTYAGSKAFSEVETRVIRDIIHEHSSRMVLYLSLHSYGSMILYSWGHDGSLSNHAFALQAVGVNMAEAISEKALSNFPKYVVGNSFFVIGYATSGASHDYAHNVGVPLAFTYELPGLSRGFMGFHLEPEYIRQVAEETWEGIVVGAKRARELFGY